MDVIVIGAGHAGCEAAAAAARIGAKVGLITLRADNIGQLSCNPAIGGLGKGHLVREVDALDGLMGKAADKAGIQFRLLNRSKGPAVQGPRVQADRLRYAAAMQMMLTESGVTVIEGGVVDLDVQGERVAGARLADGRSVQAAATILTTGTFLHGLMHCGDHRIEGGRKGESAPATLSGTLRRLGLRLGRLKTGTPPRLDGRTIDWAMLAMQPGDCRATMLSGEHREPVLPQVMCAITRTTVATHAIIRANIARSPMYSGALTSAGPRYCPSIEDKVMRFGDRDGHLVFLEPEGLDDPTIYPNGISTGLPADLQALLVRTLPGCERARITQPGYAVEYDHIDPRGLGPDLAVLGVTGLFCAGQINGTTGYEEAAAQGLMAGINAARWVAGDAPATIDRATGYIGVMIDDLVTRGVAEPYRMFTSRAEYRLRLRVDNADLRLTPLGVAWGCVGPGRRADFARRLAARDSARALLDRLTASPTRIAAAGAQVAHDGVVRSAFDWLRYPDLDWPRAVAIWPELAQIPLDLAEELAADARYATYLERQDADVAAFARDERLRLPDALDYAALPGLSREAAEKLALARPATLGAAARVAGVTPGALTCLLAHVRRAA